MISALHSIGPAAAGVPFPPSGAGEVLLIASVGFLGMGLSDLASGIFGDDEDEDDSGTDDGGDFAGEGDLDGGSLDGDLEGDDDFGDLDGWDDDEELGDDGGGVSDLEPRLDELENEVASISSSMGTVRSENEAINETVDEIEDNIRKLLDIYEMVTRGVNPFVDEPGGGGGGGMEGSFGLFDDASTPESGADDLDPDVANADPDDFFDDDFDDEPSDEFADEFDEDLEDEAADQSATEDPEPEPADSDGGEESGGKTFDDLKSEYQSGDAEWDDDQDTDPSAGEKAETTAKSVVADADVSTDEPSKTASDDGAVTSASTDEDTEADEEPTAPSTDPGDGKPYLETLPGGYASELLVIEWLTYLRDCSGTAEALRAIRYYETIGWIGEAAAGTLQRYLTGLDEGETADAAGTQLTIDHHTNSLRYIGRLGGADVDVERLEWGSSAPAPDRIERRGHRGIQR